MATKLQPDVFRHFDASLCLGFALGASITGWTLTTGKPVWPLAILYFGWLGLESSNRPASSMLHLTRAASAASLSILALYGIASVVMGLLTSPWTYLPSTLISGREVFKIWLLSHGQSIYPPPGEYPFLVTLYTPLFFAFGAALNSLIDNPCLSGTIQTAISFTIILITMFFWIWKHGGSWAIALLTTTLFATSKEIFNTGTTIRPDWMAWIFAYSGALLVMSKNNTTRSLTLGALLLGAAALTKQQTLPVIIAVTSFWIFDRPRLPRSLYTGTIIGLLGLTSFILLQHLTGGAFLIHTVEYPSALASNQEITNWDSGQSRIIQFAISNCIVLSVWFVNLLTDTIRKKILWLDWVILVSVPFLIPLLMTWGAADNYFWGIMLALYVRVGIAAATITHNRPMLYPIAAILFIFALHLQPPSFFKRHFLHDDPPTQHARDTMALQKQIASEKSTLLNAELFGYITSPRDIGQLYFFDAIETLYFEKTNFWKLHGSALERDIISKKFGTIALGNTFMNPTLQSIVNYFYSPTYSSPSLTIYSSRPGREILFTVPTDSLITDNDLQLRVSAIYGVHVNSGFGGFSFSRSETSSQSYIEFSLTKQPGPSTIEVVFHPKVASYGADNKIEVEMSAEDGQLHPIFSSSGTPKDMANHISAFPAFFSLTCNAPIVRFRFHLKGNGQIWFAPELPILYRVIYDDN